MMTSKGTTGRPKKAPGEARDNRIVVWVNARERARYLVNAARAGVTAAEFARGLLCHDCPLPSADNDNGPAREILVFLTPGQHRSLLASASKAGETPESYLTKLLQADIEGSQSSTPIANDFELVDALTRIGTTLNALAPIIMETGCSPHEFNALMKKLDAVLDRVLPP